MTHESPLNDLLVHWCVSNFDAKPSLEYQDGVGSVFLLRAEGRYCDSILPSLPKIPVNSGLQLGSMGYAIIDLWVALNSTKDFELLDHKLATEHNIRIERDPAGFSEGVTWLAPSALHEELSLCHWKFLLNTPGQIPFVAASIQNIPEGLQFSSPENGPHSAFKTNFYLTALGIQPDFHFQSIHGRQVSDICYFSKQNDTKDTEGVETCIATLSLVTGSLIIHGEGAGRPDGLSANSPRTVSHLDKISYMEDLRPPIYLCATDSKGNVLVKEKSWAEFCKRSKEVKATCREKMNYHLIVAPEFAPPNPLLDEQMSFEP